MIKKKDSSSRWHVYQLSFKVLACVADSFKTSIRPSTARVSNIKDGLWHIRQMLHFAPSTKLRGRCLKYSSQAWDNEKVEFPALM